MEERVWKNWIFKLIWIPDIVFVLSIWKKGVAGKGGDRSRWLNSPNVYQKVEVLETGTPDPKKITKVEIITFEDKTQTKDN